MDFKKQSLRILCQITWDLNSSMKKIKNKNKRKFKK